MKRTAALILVGVVGAAAAAVWWWAPKATPAASRAPNVVLVTLDTTRADRIGAYGEPSGATPVIDRLAREGVVFEQAVAPAPLTLPAHATLFTGVDPPFHGVRDNGGYIL